MRKNLSVALSVVLGLSCLATPWPAPAATMPERVTPEAYQRPTEDAPQRTLFALGGLLCGAASVAHGEDLAALHRLLLDCPNDANVDRLYPLRLRVAQQVQRWPVAARQTALRFVLAHAMAITNLNALVVQLVGPPPTFSPVDGAAVAGLSDRWEGADRRILSHLLVSAWRDAHLDALWSEVQLSWQASQVDSGAVRAVAHTLDRYVHVSQSRNLTLGYVTIDPLMPAGSGVTSIFADDHYVVILGPSAAAADAQTLLAHELSHPLISAFLRADLPVQRALGRASCVYDAVTGSQIGRAGIGNVYVGWDVYFAETLARSLSHHLMQTQELPDGFVLQPVMAEELRRYDASHGNFEQFLVHALGHLQGQFCHAATPLAGNAHARLDGASTTRAPMT